MWYPRPPSPYTRIPTTGLRWYEILKQYQAGTPTLGTAKVRPATCEPVTPIDDPKGRPSLCEPGLVHDVCSGGGVDAAP